MLIRHLGNHNLLPVFIILFNMNQTANLDNAAAGLVSRDDPLVADNQATGGKIRALDMAHNIAH